MLTVWLAAGRRIYQSTSAAKADVKEERYLIH